MPAPSVLFIGGTGVISTASVARAVASGLNVTVLNRGRSSRPVADGAEVLVADISDAEQTDAALGSREFDAVVEMVAFTPDQVQRDIDRFTGRTGQYVFISSASAYQKPVLRLPITESTPLRNPYWKYSRDKIACEDLLVAAYRESGFPATIVRPSHTYDESNIPAFGGWTAVERMRQGKPIPLHGDGTSLWTLTHSDDFAKGFVGLLANPLTIGDSFQITSDFVYTWNEIYAMLGRAAGALPDLRYVASETIEAAGPESGGGHLGDRSHSVVFDNSKVKALVPEFVATIPFSRAVYDMVAWHDADPSRRVIDPAIDALFDRLTR